MATDEQRRNLRKCPDCGHHVYQHVLDIQNWNCIGGGLDNCSCSHTRTYLHIQLDELESRLESQQITCPCQTWAYSPELLEKIQPGLKYGILPRHHPSCDGKGGHKDGVFRESDLSVEAFAGCCISSPHSGECVEPQADAPTGIDPSSLIWHDNPDALLSLLIIDLGDCCVVRVERGEQFIFNTLPIPSVAVHQVHGPLVLNVPFAAVRDAIDSQDKPLPRLERRDNRESPWLYQLFDVSGADGNYLTSAEYAALSELAGKPLPIYEPTEGKWTELCRAGQPTLGPNDSLNIPVGVWRYTR